MAKNKAWAEVKKFLGKNNKQIASEIGLTESGVKHGSRDSNNMSSWALGMILMLEKINENKKEGRVD